MSNYRRSHSRQKAHSASRIRELASENLSPAVAVECGAAPNPDYQAVTDTMNEGRASYKAYQARVREQVAKWNEAYRYDCRANLAQAEAQI